MMIKHIALTAATLALLAPLGAQAGEVHNRINNEQGRINQGVSSGQLTNGEYNRVEGRLDHINAQRERDLRSNGGTLTRGEYRRLNGEENRLSNQIYFDKHNVRRQS
jgi:hypothetical protein